jgi:hypothetical protein
MTLKEAIDHIERHTDATLACKDDIAVLREADKTLHDIHEYLVAGGSNITGMGKLWDRIRKLMYKNIGL